MIEEAFNFLGIRVEILKRNYITYIHKNIVLRKLLMCNKGVI